MTEGLIFTCHQFQQILPFLVVPLSIFPAICTPPRFSLSPMLSSQTPDKHKMGWQPDGEWSPRGAGDLILPRLTPGDPDLRWALRVALIWSPGNKCGAVCTGAEKALSTQRMAGAVQEPTFLPPPVTCHFFSFSQVSTVDPESTDLLDRAHSLAL